MIFDLDLIFSKFISKDLMCQHRVVVVKIVEKRKKKRGEIKGKDGGGSGWTRGLNKG